MTHARLIVSPAIGTFRHAERSFRGKILAMEYYTTLWTDMNYFIGSKFFSVFFFYSLSVSFQFEEFYIYV